MTSPGDVLADPDSGADTPTPAGHPLDNPIWAALTGPHRHFAEFGSNGRAARYPPDVAPFVALPDEPDAVAWADFAELVGPGTQVPVVGVGDAVPADWPVLWRGAGVQMTDVAVDPAHDPEAEVLGAADVPEMLALVARTEPGPFRPRTRELGTYLGVRHDGALVAMAGERLHVPGWTEISAVCTDAAHRRRGLAGRLVRAVAAGIRARGETPFLHAAATNTNAIRLYEHLGFAIRRTADFTVVRTPG